MITTEKQQSERICHGDIYKDIKWIKRIKETDGIIEVSGISFPLVIVLSQDCDLNYDSQFRREAQQTGKHDKFLISVLVGPLYNIEHVQRGEHLSELGLTMAEVVTKGNSGKALKNNKNPRYHYLDFPESDRIQPSVVDFKHYFSVDVHDLEEIRRSNFVCRVGTLFREDLSQRFASFLSRIALPPLKREEG